MLEVLPNLQGSRGLPGFPSDLRLGPGSSRKRQVSRSLNVGPACAQGSGGYSPPAGGTTWSSSFMLVRFQIFLMMARSSSLACSRFPVGGTQADWQLSPGRPVGWAGPCAGAHLAARGLCPAALNVGSVSSSAGSRSPPPCPLGQLSPAPYLPLGSWGDPASHLRLLLVGAARARLSPMATCQEGHREEEWSPCRPARVSIPGGL